MGEKWSDSGYLLKAEPSGFPEGLDMGWGKKLSRGFWLERQEEWAVTEWWGS